MEQIFKFPFTWEGDVKPQRFAYVYHTKRHNNAAVACSSLDPLEFPAGFLLASLLALNHA